MYDMILPISHLNHELNQMVNAAVQPRAVVEQNMDRTESKTIETNRNSFEFSTTIYKFIFYSIKFFIVYTRFLSSACLHWYFWILLQFQNLKSDKNASNYNVNPPREISVILNELNLKEGEVYDLFYLIAEFFSSINVEKLNFYHQKGIF
jgi:hypothetical protein